MTSALVCTVLLAGCSGVPTDRAAPGGGSTSGGPGADGVQVGRYVALGDSFTAGPLVPQTDLADGCLRSSGNYPSLLARSWHAARLVDVSCSGATTADLTARQRTVGETSVPPQVREVTPSTDVVTLGIGGNDGGLFSSLLSGCATGPDAPQTFAPCGTGVAGLVGRAPALLRQLSDRLGRVLAEVSARAPDAAVVLVGYLRLVPRQGTCRQLNLPADLVPDVARLQRLLARAQAQAAAEAGARFVDMNRGSAGHDVCSQEPWVNGSATDRSAALAFHPLAAGMRATAQAVAPVVEQASSRG